MTRSEVDITLAVDKGDDQEAWRRSGGPEVEDLSTGARVASVELLKRSIDARKAPVQFSPAPAGGDRFESVTAWQSEPVPLSFPGPVPAGQTGL